MNVQRAVVVALIGWLCRCAPPVTKPMDPEPPTLEVPATSATEPWRLPRLTLRAAGGDDTVLQLFVSANCSGPELLRRPIEAFREGVELDAVNGVNVFSATALTRAGLRSRCSPAASVEVRLPMRGPTGAPFIQSISPMIPTNERSVRLMGSAPSGWMVRVWSKPDCEGVVLASGPASEFESEPGLEVPLEPNASLLVSLDASLGSELTQCGLQTTRLTNDSTPPTLVPDLFPRPPHPFRHNAIVVADLEARASVRLRAGRGCGGAAVNPTGVTYCEAERCAWVLFPLPTDATFSLWATDGLGNESACVTVEQQVTPQGSVPLTPLWRSLGPSHLIFASPTGLDARVFDGPDCLGSDVFGSATSFGDVTLFVVTDQGQSISARLSNPPEGVEFPCVRIR